MSEAMDETGKRYERRRDQQKPLGPTDWRWYITIAAVRQWMNLTGRTGELEADNPDFVAAQAELGALSLTARLSVAASERECAGSSIYRGKVTFHGKRRRVECVVMPPVRKEGPLPQLVRVIFK